METLEVVFIESQPLVIEFPLGLKGNPGADGTGLPEGGETGDALFLDGSEPVWRPIEIGDVEGVESALEELQSGKEPSIIGGDASQYWNGSKAWASFAASVRGSVLTGISFVSGVAITASDTALQAFGKLQKQIETLSSGKLDISSFTWDDMAGKPVGTTSTPYFIPQADEFGKINNNWLASTIARITDLTWTAIAGKPNVFAPEPHIHNFADIRDNDDNTLYDALDGKVSNSDVSQTPQVGKIPLPLGTGFIADGWISANIARSADVASALADKADLVDGKIPADQMPGYVDDVLEYDTLPDFPVTGESGKVYVAKDTNKSYRWAGSIYVELAGGVALGETSATAYRGDRGKIAYDHSQITGNPHGTAIGDIYGLQTAIDGKAALAHTHAISDITTLQATLDAKAKKLPDAVVGLGWCNNLNAAGFTTSALAADILYAWPFDMATGIQANDWYSRLVGAGVGNAAMAIYSDLNNYPNAPETATVNPSLTTLATQSFSIATFTLNPGRHWLVLNQAGIATWRSVAATSMPKFLGIDLGTFGGASQATGYSIANAYTGSLPATFPGSAALVYNSPAPLVGANVDAVI